MMSLYSYPMGSHTFCGWEKADKTVKECGQRPRGGKDMFLQLSDEITYDLWAGKGGQTVKMSFYSYPMRSRTF